MILKTCLSEISLEPLVILVSFATGLPGAFIPSEHRKKIEFEYADDLALLPQNETYSYIQQRLTQWSIYKAIVARPLFILMTLLLGAVSDIHGRKPLMVLALGTVVVSTFALNCFYNEALALPMWFVLVQAFVYNICGGRAADTVSDGYIVDRFPDQEVLSLRLTILMVLGVIAAIVANTISATVYFYVGLDGVFLMAQCLVATAFFYCILFIADILPTGEKNTEGVKMETAASSTGRNRQQVSTVANPPVTVAAVDAQDVPKPVPVKKELSTKIKELLLLELEAVKVVFKPRERNKRICLLLTVIVGSVTGIAEKQEDELIGIYTQQPPFNWGHNEFRIFTNANLIAVTIGSLVGMVIFKKCFGFRDTTIMLIGLFVNIIDVGTIALATDSMFIYIGTLLCDGFVFAIIPAGMSFLSTLVPNNEIGKVFAVFAVCENFQALMQLAVLQPIYYFTVAWFKPLIWYILVALNVVSLAGMAYVHVRSSPEGTDTVESLETNVELKDQPSASTT